MRRESIMDVTFAENPKRGGRRQMDSEPGVTPWQVRAIVTMGVPAAIACYLVYILASTVSGAQNNQQATLNNLVMSVSAMQSEHGQIRLLNESMLRVLQASCANNAQTEEKRANCFR